MCYLLSGQGRGPQEGAVDPLSGLGVTKCGRLHCDLQAAEVWGLGAGRGGVGPPVELQQGTRSSSGTVVGPPL